MSSQPFELQLEDGTVVKAPNIEEGLKIVAKMKTDTAAALREERTKREALEQQQTALAAQVEQLRQQSQPKPQNNGGYDKDHYWKLMNEDPMLAQNYLDAHRFGIENPEEVPTTFRRLQEDVQKNRGDQLGTLFIQQHYEDFPATPESADKLAKRVKELSDQGYPLTLDTMNLAYSKLIDEGSIKPLETKPREQEEPNPSLGGSGASAIPETELAKAEQMPTDELEKYLRAKGMLA